MVKPAAKRPTAQSKSHGSKQVPQPPVDSDESDKGHISSEEDRAPKKGRGRPSSSLKNSSKPKLAERSVRKSAAPPPPEDSEQDDTDHDVSDEAPASKQQGRGRSASSKNGSKAKSSTKPLKGKAKAKSAPKKEQSPSESEEELERAEAQPSADSGSDSSPQPSVKNSAGKKASKRKSEEHVSQSEEEDEEKPISSKGKVAKGVKGKGKGKSPARASSLPPAKKVKTDDTASSEEDETEYEVDRILEVTIHKNGKRDFLVKWKGYSAKNATWEPEANLSCEDAIKHFLDKAEKDHVSRARRLRQSTQNNSRASKSRQLFEEQTRVLGGRIEKRSRSESRTPAGPSRRTVETSGNRVVEEINKVNDTLSKNKVKKLQEERAAFIDAVRKENLQGGTVSPVGVLRGAGLFIAAGLSISAAYLYSPASPFTYDRLMEHFAGRYTTVVETVSDLLSFYK